MSLASPCSNSSREPESSRSSFIQRQRALALRELARLYEPARGLFVFRLRRGPALIVERRRARLDQSAARLRALSPRATLERGYAIVRRREELLRSAADVSPGDPLEIQLADGRVGARAE